MWLGSPIEQISTDEQHLCCSRIEALDAIMWKSIMKDLKIPSNEESMEATIQRKRLQDLDISNQVDIGLYARHLCDNCRTFLKLLELKCKLTEIVRWKPFTIILLDEMEKYDLIFSKSKHLRMEITFIPTSKSISQKYLHY